MKPFILLINLFLAGAHDYKCSVVHGVCASSIVYFLNGFVKQPFVCWHPSVNGSDLCMKPTISSQGYYPNGRHWVVVACDGFRDPNASESWHPFTCAV